MNAPIHVVSGLPRSGTSLMMQMLDAAGIPPLTDGQRAADADNPRGYYEFERVKKIKEDSSWMADAPGKAVKIISALLPHLPEGYAYKIVFMIRRMDEILASQRKMLERRGVVEAQPDDDAMQRHFEGHLARIRALMESRPDIEAFYCDYNRLLDDPPSVANELAAFLGGGAGEAASMAAVVDARLYRQRSRE